jgi:ABC-2 type transport system permease protein
MGGAHNGLKYHDLFLAGLNTLPAAIFTLSAAIFALGILPRFTTLIAYGVIAWSFLVQLLASGSKISHWVLDTFVFAHISFAPAVDPRWGPAWILIILGALLATGGALAFNRRDHRFR